MANQKKYNHPEAPENIDIKEEIQKMVSDFKTWLKKAKAKLDTKPTYVKVLVYGAIAAITILLALKAFIFLIAWLLFLILMGVPTLTYLIPDSMKTPEQIRIDKELKRGMEEYSEYIQKQEKEHVERVRRQEILEEQERESKRHHY